MKILFVGYHNPHFITITEYIESAVNDLGHQLITFDYRDWLIPGRFRDRFPKMQNWDLNRINRRLLRKVADYRPELVIINGGWTIDASTINEIRSRYKAVTVNWIADFPLMFDRFLEVGPHYDYFFASGSDALKRYEEAGHQNGYWLPFACDTQVHKPLVVSDEEQKQYGADICFVGSNYTERVEVLEQLVDFDLRIWGWGWDRLPKESPLHKCVRGGPLDAPEWVKVFNASRIVLNIIGHRCDVTEPYVPEDDFRMTNTKVFEILGCRSFQLCDAKADAETLFEHGKHMVFYKDPEHCKKLIKEYLEDSNRREEIAKKGYEEVLTLHTYKHRIKAILDKVSL